MKKKLLFICLSMLPQSSIAQCFEEKALNQILESTLKMKCAEFPTSIPLESLYMDASGTFHIRQKDMNRFPNLVGMAVNNKTPDTLKLVVHGIVAMPPLLEELALYTGKKGQAIDLNHGNLKFEKKVAVVVSYQEKSTFEKILSWNLKSIGIWASGQDLVGARYEFPEEISIHGFRKISNSSFKAGKSIEIYGEDTVVELSSSVFASGGTLVLANARVKSENHFSFQGQLSLANMTSEGAFLMEEKSSIKRLYLENVNTAFQCPACFEETNIITANKATLSSFSLPSTLEKLEYMEMMDGSTNMQQLPLMPNLKSLNLSGSDLSHLTGNLIVNPTLGVINLNETKMKNLVIDLKDPSSLNVVYALGNDFEKITILSAENSKKLPPRFTMHVDSKALAQQLRNTLQIHGVAASQW